MTPRQEIRSRAEAFLRSNGVFQDASAGVRVGQTFIPSFAVLLEANTDEIQIIGSIRDGKTLLWMDLHVGSTTILAVRFTEAWERPETWTWESPELEAVALDSLRRAMILDDLADV